MKYLGGKHRLGKEIAKVLKFLFPSHKKYLEPFCGALGVLRHMSSEYKCLASDLQCDMIKLWKEVKNNTFIPPKKITNKYYEKIKKSKGPTSMRGFVGFLCSWNGMYFAGLAEYKNTKRNVVNEAINDIKKIRPQIKNVKFMCKSYEKHSPKNTLIYCDPPYEAYGLLHLLHTYLPFELIWKTFLFL